MLNPRPIHSLAKAACTIALALTSTHLRADTFTQVNLVSNVPGLAAFTDPNLINPWGIANSATSPFWISNQGTGTATLYTGTGAPQALVVTVPGGGPPSGPTGQVFNNGPANGFLVGAAKATFIFDTLNGTIAAWNGAAGTLAQVVATTPGAVFTGLAQGTVAGTTYLYAANVAGDNIRIFDGSWNDVSSSVLFAGKFSDPNGKSGFVPFNVQQVGANLYVTYAQLGPGGTPLPGGYVVVYDANGNFIKQIGTGPLFAPWGITLAPSNFGIYSNDLLIGNFGSGTILAYDPITDAYLGTLNDLNGNAIVNDRLWALETRTGGAGVNTSAVYFTAGINNEQGGLFGAITEVPEPATIIETASGLIALAMMKIRSRRH